MSITQMAVFQYRFETPPYDRSSIRSVYHVREVDAFKLGQLTGKVDVGLSHDWPCGIYNHGDVHTLLQKKPFFRRVYMLFICVVLTLEET